MRHLILETAADSPAHRLLLGLGFTATYLESIGPVDNIAYAWGAPSLPPGNQKLRELQEIEA